MTDLLADSLCYLIGAIDNAADQGIGWRKRFISLCRDAGLLIKFLDPTNKVEGFEKEDHEKVVLLKQHEDWDGLTRFMGRIVRQDHRCVDLSDFMVFYLDPSIHTCGSYFELQSALTQKKPYFIVVPGGKSKVPSWLFGICDHKNFYPSIEDVVKSLVLLNSGIQPMSDRWVLFRKQINKL